MQEANSNWQLAVGQSEEPRPNPPVADVIYRNEFNARQLEYFKRGYAIDQYGTMTPPEYFRKEGEDRLKGRLGLPYDMTNQQKLAEWHKRQLALLEKADAAPRCEYVYIDGTTCQSPRMRKHQYCYAHERMLEVRPKKLKLLPAEDENSIMWNVMEIQRALIDDEISEKKAGLLLYAQQLQLIAVRGVTFKMTEPGAMVRSMPKEVSRELTRMNTNEESAADERRETQKNHTTDDTDGTDQSHGCKSGEPQRGAEDRVIGRSGDHPREPKAGSPGAPDTEARRKEELGADERRETQKNHTTDDTDGTDQNHQPQRTQRNRVIGRSGDRKPRTHEKGPRG